MTVNERDTAVDFVKFIAVFLVMNSHMGICYPKYQFLATGGAFGDALFFFVSGYTLFLSRTVSRFDNWYKRRIRRIYPSLFATAIIGTFAFGKEYSFISVVLAKQYWFIQCIFFLYPLLYLAKKYIKRHWLLLGIMTTLVMAAFPLIRNNDSFIYGGGYYRWAVYLVFMLFGAVIGKERKMIGQISIWLSLFLVVFFVVAWYGSVYLWGSSWLQVFSILPLMGVVLAVYFVGMSKPVERVFHTDFIGPILISIGALCLESYLIQKMVFTDAWNSIFPWNIPIIMAIVLFVSYCAKILANVICQLFDSQEFNWGCVLRVY